MKVTYTLPYGTNEYPIGMIFSEFGETIYFVEVVEGFPFRSSSLAAVKQMADDYDANYTPPA